MQIIEATGKACPMPVILTKRALKAHPEEQLKVQVDNEIATQNLKKMAEQLGLVCEVEKKSATLFEVSIQNGEASQEEPRAGQPYPDETLSGSPKPYIVVLHTDTIGKGSDDLGSTLMKSFLFALSEQEQLPEKILFYNGGAKLTIEGSPVLEDLKTMEAAGVEMLTCGICLEYYHSENKLAVGSPTNMYRIVELESTYKTVCP